MDSQQAILYYIQQVAILIHRQSDQVLQERLGMGVSQYRILRAVQANPSVQQKQIAGLLGQTEASISRQIKLMRQRGMISVRANPDNKREHLTMLQPRGERLLEVASQTLAQYHAPTMGLLSDKDQAQLAKMLRGLHSGLSTIDGTETSGLDS